MDERKPDLEGVFYQAKYQLVEEFKMYIDKKKKRNNKFLILGEITDKFGIATFQGTISRKFIKFIKLYDINAVDNEGAEQLYYKGRWRNKTYSKRDKERKEEINCYEGVYLFTTKNDPESKKHVDMLMEEHPGETFELKIMNDNLRQDLLSLGKI